MSGPHAEPPFAATPTTLLQRLIAQKVQLIPSVQKEQRKLTLLTETAMKDVAMNERWMWRCDDWHHCERRSSSDDCCSF